MRSVFLLPVIACLLLAETDPKKYQEALDQFSAKNYENAYAQFNALLKDDIGNADLNFYLGRSAFELKQYETALAAFERAAIAQPDNLRYRLEFARTLFNLQLFAEARAEFQAILDTGKLPEAAAKNVRTFISTIDDNRQKHNLNAVALLGVTRDTNINSTSNVDSFTIPALNDIEVTNSTQKETGTAHLEMLNLIHTYDFGEVGKYGMSSSFLVFAQTWDNRSDKNVMYSMLSAGPTYSAKDYMVNTQFMFEKLWYGSEHFLTMYDVYPQFSWTGFPSWVLGAKYKYQKKDWVQDADKGKDSVYMELEGTLKKTFDPQHVGDFGLKFMRERKDQGDTTGVDLDGYQAKAGYTYLYSDEWNVNPVYTYKKTHYLDEDVLQLIKRNDDQHIMTLNSTYTYSKKASVLGSVNHTINKSNIPSNRYDKTTYALNLIYIF